jgi:CDP-diglyceride synthetase
MDVNGMQSMVVVMLVLMLMSATLMRMRHVASVAEGLIPGSPSQVVQIAPTIQRGWMSMEMAVDTMQILVALMPIYMLVLATLLRMQLVASVMEAFSLENLNQPVRDVV